MVFEVRYMGRRKRVVEREWEWMAVIIAQETLQLWLMADQGHFSICLVHILLVLLAFTMSVTACSTRKFLEWRLVYKKWDRLFRIKTDFRCSRSWCLFSCVRISCKNFTSWDFRVTCAEIQQLLLIPAWSHDFSIRKHYRRAQRVFSIFITDRLQPIQENPKFCLLPL